MSTPIEYRLRGQAVWLDSISSKMIHSGRLSSLIEAGSIYGVTSNPTIFGQAILKNEGDYNVSIERLVRDGKDAFAIYDELTRKDIAEGADAFRALHDRNPVDGWISLEVLPSLAADTQKTVNEAKRLSSALARPNVFIKVPATPAGVPAIRRLIGEGISINITL
ncbi:MAG: transaldolase family protein, partial [Thermoanaerobaculia bacterium]